MKRIAPVFLFALLFSVAAGAAEAPSSEPIAWRRWSDDLFETAKKENKLVILDLEAVWCHWCHVMADTTYKDPQVVKLIGDHYLAVRVDQDADPELSLKYEEWGWPATIVFSPDGQELVKRRGYIPPAPMASLLDAVVKDPTPGPSVKAETEIPPAPAGTLAPEDRKALEAAHDAVWDETNGGWGSGHKLIDWPSLEYAMKRARAGDKTQEARARRTLDQALNLMDREWGGFFQYSDQDDWKSPHYEKIMSIQAQYLRAYSLAYAIWKDPKYLDAAVKVTDFVGDYWTSPEDAFCTSQDADVDEATPGQAFYSLDDKGRRALGKLPRIDAHVYARENGWMIASLASLYDVTGEPHYLMAAVQAARWIVENRSLKDGGFRHDAEDRSGPYLGDTLAMGQAFLALYVSSGEREWLDRAEKAADFIDAKFRAADGGFVSTA
ncbi:MAG TPA: DUF255 domain-containing protein, partial [Candidatus Eisenbacteria bacterium]|nr:DUF255 domain-containing protein [Candidatus Eisenbacteria bacterium]